MLTKKLITFALITTIMSTCLAINVDSKGGNLNKELDYDYLMDYGYYSPNIVINTSRVDSTTASLLKKAVNTWNKAIDKFDPIEERQISDIYGDYGLDDLESSKELDVNEIEISTTNKSYRDPLDENSGNFLMFTNDNAIKDKKSTTYKTNNVSYKILDTCKGVNEIHNTKKFLILIDKSYFKSLSQSKKVSTFVHELGHVLGLDEALSTDYFESESTPSNHSYIVDKYKIWRYSIMYDEDSRLGYISWLDILEVAKSWNIDKWFTFNPDQKRDPKYIKT